MLSRSAAAHPGRGSPRAARVGARVRSARPLAVRSRAGRSGYARGPRPGEEPGEERSSGPAPALPDSPPRSKSRAGRARDGATAAHRARVRRAGVERGPRGRGGDVLMSSPPIPKRERARPPAAESKTKARARAHRRRLGHRAASDHVQAGDGDGGHFGGGRRGERREGAGGVRMRDQNSIPKPA